MNQQGHNMPANDTPPGWNARCPDEGELWRALTIEGEPPGLGAHLAACAACRSLAEQIRASERVVAEARTWVSLGADTPPEAADATDVPGYRLLREIHRGAQGVVFEAEQRRTLRRVAVKMLLAGTYATARQRARFAREIEAIAGLSHPWIVTLHSSFVLDDGRCGFAMEYVEGQPLDQWWSKLSPSRDGTRRLVSLFVRICGAVQHAHVSGVIHRDLKPSNVLVTQDGQGADAPKVLDFGIARAIADQGTTSSITMTGEFAGTPAYAAPEQVGGGMTADVRTDVHAIGVMLYEALCGRPPYGTEGNAYELAHRILTHDPARPRELAPRIDRDLETIILRALEKDPARRYQSAADLGDDLARFLGGLAVMARRDSTFYVVTKYAARRKGTVAVIAATVLAAAAFVVHLAVTNRTLDAQRQDLQRALDESRLTEARRMSNAGEFTEAERILWDRADRLGIADTNSVDRMYSADPPNLITAWALWQIYHQSRCAWTFDTGWRENTSVPMAVTGLVGAGVVRLCSDRTMLDLDVRTGEALGDRALARKPRSMKHRYSNSGGGRMAEVRGNVLEVFELLTGRSVWVQSDFDASRIASMSLNASGAYIAAMTSDRELIVMSVGEPPSRAPVLRRTCLLIDGMNYMSPAWNHAGDVVTVMEPDFSVAFVHVPSGRTTALIPGSPDRRPVGASFAADGRTVVLTLDESVGELWDIDQPRKLADFEDGISQSSRFILSPSGRMVLAVSPVGRTISLIETSSGRTRAVFRGHVGMITDVAFSGDETMLISADDRGWVKAWHIALPGEPETILPASTATPHDVKQLRDGRLAICGAAGLWGISSRSATGEWSAPRTTDSASRMDNVLTELAPIGETGLAVASRIGPPALVVRSLVDGSVVDEINPGILRPNSVSLDPSGRLAVTAGYGGVALVDLTTRAVTPLRTDPASIYSGAVFSPDGSMIALAGYQVPVTIVAFPQTTRSRDLDSFPRRVRSLAFSHDSRAIYAAGSDRILRGWNAATGERVLEYVNSSEIFAIDVHPLNQTALIGDRDGRISLIDLRTAERLAILTEAGTAIFRVRFIRDGQAIAYTTHDGRAVVQNLAWPMECILRNQPRSLPAAGGRGRVEPAGVSL